MKSFKSFITEEEYPKEGKNGKKVSVGKNTVKINPNSDELKEAEVQPPMERLKTDRNMYSIPQSERDAAKARLLAKTAAKRKEMEKVKESLSFSDFMEARRMDKEGVDRGDSRRAERAAKAKASLEAVKKGEERKVKVSKKYNIPVSDKDTLEKRAHKQNHPGSRQEPKERGAKETPLQTHNRRVNRQVSRVVKHGYTSKEKKDNAAMAKHTSRFD